MLPLDKGQNEYYVLSVGFEKKGIPLVTILENGESRCYRLPDDYSEWAMTAVGMANSGEKIVPGTVVFSMVDGRFDVEV